MAKQLSRTNLSPDQQNALDLMIHWYQSSNSVGQPFVLKGAAGTGKTSILPVLMRQLGIPPLNAIGLATSAMAAKNIGDKTKIMDVRTMASFLKLPQLSVAVKHKGTVEVCTSFQETYRACLRRMRLGKGSVNSALDHVFENAVSQCVARVRKTVPTFNLSLLRALKFDYPALQDVLLRSIDIRGLNRVLGSAGFVKLDVQFLNRSQLLNSNLKLRFKDCELMIVDEISMIPEYDIDKLLEIADYVRVPVLMVGDPFQLEPVNARASHYLFDDNYQYQVKLLKLHRQSNQIAVLGSMLRPPHAMVLGDAVNTLGQQHHYQIPELEPLYQPQLTQALRNGTFYPKLLDADVVLALSNQAVQTLTDGMRASKYHLSSTVAVNDGLRLNDKVRIAVNEQNDMVRPDKRFMNGMLGRIVKIYDDATVINQLQQIKVSRPESPEDLHREAQLVKELALLAGANDDTVADIIKAMQNQHDSVAIQERMERNQAVKLYQALALKCVDIEFENGLTHHHVFVNTVALHNPRLSKADMYGAGLRMIGHARNNLPFFYDLFERVVLRASGSPYYDALDNHASIVYVTFGYALTVYKAQGREWGHVVYACLAFQNQVSMSKLNYTAVTRAKQRLTLLFFNYNRIVL